jgi:hypothetical protein
MLLCFACSWPVSIIKTLKTKFVLGKSPLFMTIILVGYVFGIVHKILYNYDAVTFLYIFNFMIVSIDLSLYFIYIEKNKAEINKN